MRRPVTGTAVAVVAVVALALAACSASGEAEPTNATSSRAPTSPGGSPAVPSGAVPSASGATPSGSLALGEVAPSGPVRDVATGLDAPWSVVLDGDVPLISERDSGDVLELLADGRTRVVGAIPGISHGGEGGLLGLAVHDERLYVYSTGRGGNRIQWFPLRGGPGSLGIGSATTVISGLPSNTFHDGGRIAFGPDGMLYASVGDAGDSTEAQDRGSLAGKILRMTPDGAVPDDNPFPGSPIWSLGHRNVQGLGWTADGTMFASEFGQDRWDELNVIVPGGDYGWPEVEGRGGTSRGFVDPVQEWRTDDASPSGLAVVGRTVFVANLRGQVLRAIPVSNPSTATEYYAGTYGRLRTVLAGSDGRLWIVTNNTDGRGSPKSGDDRILSVALRPVD